MTDRDFNQQNSVAPRDEGYTKFTAHLSSGTVPWGPECVELNAARTQLHYRGWIGMYPDGIGYGNVSLRWQESADFIISGTSTGAIRKLGPNGYCMVTGWQADSNEVWCRGPIQASSESMSHGAVYKANSGIRCVLHIHNPKLFDFMLKTHYPSTPAKAAFGTPAIAIEIENLVRRDSSTVGTFAMAGHQEGIIAYGPTISAAMQSLLDIKPF